MTPEREEETLEWTKRALTTMTAMARAREPKQRGDDNGDSGKGKGGDSQKGKKGNDNELPTTLFEHKEVWIVIMSGWTTYGRVFWKNPLWIK